MRKWIELNWHKSVNAIVCTTNQRLGFQTFVQIVFIASINVLRRLGPDPDVLNEYLKLQSYPGNCDRLNRLDSLATHQKCFYRTVSIVCLRRLALLCHLFTRVAQRILLSDNFSWKKWLSRSLFPFKSNKYASSFTSDTYHTNILVFTIKVLQFPKTNLKWAICYVFGPDESGIILLTCFQMLWSHKDYWGLSETSLMKKRVSLSKLECSENNNN